MRGHHHLVGRGEAGDDPSSRGHVGDDPDLPPQRGRHLRERLRHWGAPYDRDLRHGAEHRDHPIIDRHRGPGALRETLLDSLVRLAHGVRGVQLEPEHLVSLQPGDETERLAGPGQVQDPGRKLRRGDDQAPCRCAGIYSGDERIHVSELDIDQAAAIPAPGHVRQLGVEHAPGQGRHTPSTRCEHDRIGPVRDRDSIGFDQPCDIGAGPGAKTGRGAEGDPVHALDCMERDPVQRTTAGGAFSLSVVIPDTVEKLGQRLDDLDYFADESLLVAIHIAVQLGRPLFLEGEAGVGKTEVAKVLAAMGEAELIRLQCYEGLDVGQALYEWDYARQMMAIRLLEARGEGASATPDDIMSRDYLIARPLLQAIEASTTGHRPVLLIDELDRADEEFEAFLLELLSDFQVTIPEIGTIKAETRPIVVLTSNRTREIHDALKRRCVYHWIDYPTPAREAEIITRKVPELEGGLAVSLAEAMRRLREMELFKPPGVAETLDWAESLKLLQAGKLTPSTIDGTIGVVLKYKDDIDMVRSAGVETLVG